MLACGFNRGPSSAPCEHILLDSVLFMELHLPSSNRELSFAFGITEIGDNDGKFLQVFEVVNQFSYLLHYPLSCFLLPVLRR